MDNVNNEGGPAFPRDHRYDGHNGMTLRDYFAAKAMAAIIAMPDGDYDYEEFTVAESAYLMADAMLAQRSKK